MVKVPKDVINKIMFEKTVELLKEVLGAEGVTLEEFEIESVEGVKTDVEFVIRLGMNHEEE
ncbi:hypothetical protein NNG48_07290 [Enterococcus faecium]|nr:hypothetical protein [Enterococcus faecium]